MVRRMVSGSRPGTASPPSSYVQHFDKESSLLVLGLRGSGKSTLAIIASAALSRQVIDTEKIFQQQVGASSTEYKRNHGPSLYQQQQITVLESILTTYSRNAIIVSSWLEQEAQRLFQEFATSHIAIHVVRDNKHIADYLKIQEISKVSTLVRFACAAFRRCTNYEFYNISEDDDLHATVEPGVSKHKRASTPYLTLKRVERHFLKFLSIILPDGSVPFSGSMSPLTCLPIENRSFTYVTSIPLSVLLREGVDVENLETGADAIEVLIDGLDQEDPISVELDNAISKVVANIRRDIAIPIIYHISLPLDCNLDTKRTQQYWKCFKHGLSLATEYITLDLRLENHIAHMLYKISRASKVIGHVAHGPLPDWKDDIWTSYYQTAQQIGCSVVRLTKQATQTSDNFEIENLRISVEKLGGTRIPLIAFNTGHIGRHSQCFNHVMTSVSPESLTTEADFEQDTSSTNRRPTLTARQATIALYSSFLKQSMNLFVFGANVDYSMSPAMHNTALQACGIPSTYRPYSTSTIQEIKKLVFDPTFGGASIGLPFKVDAISLTRSLSPHAEAIGAINTLVPIRFMSSGGKNSQEQAIIQGSGISGPVLGLYGENTDWIGIRACLRRGLSPANAVRPFTCGLIIGSGGMARAATYAMLQLGVKNIVIFNRTKSNAEEMVRHFIKLLASNSVVLSGIDTGNVRFHILDSLDELWPTSEFRLPTLIASCIPTHSIGETPSPRFELPNPWMASPTGGVVIEFAYKYLNTPLLKQVRAEAHRGWVAMDGLDLLPEQGFAQFELFTGRRAPRRLMRDEVFRAYPDIHGQSARRQLLPRMEEIIVQES